MFSSLNIDWYHFNCYVSCNIVLVLIVSTLGCFQSVLQDGRREVVSFPNNKPWVTKGLKNIINEKKPLFINGDKVTFKRKKKELLHVIVKYKEEYRKEI